MINKGVLQDAKERMLTMDEYVYLFYGVQSQEVDLSVNVPKLIRLGYLDNSMAFTDSCLELVPDYKPEATVNRFEEFWEKYPKSDEIFNYLKTRSLAINKSATRKEYIKQAAIYGEDTIIDALDAEVKDRFSMSLKKNAFSFMKSSINYLKTQQFLEYA